MKKYNKNLANAWDLLNKEIHEIKDEKQKKELVEIIIALEKYIDKNEKQTAFELFFC